MDCLGATGQGYEPRFRAEYRPHSSCISHRWWEARVYDTATDTVVWKYSYCSTRWRAKRLARKRAAPMNNPNAEWARA